MAGKFIVLFKTDPKQELSKGSIVTYIDEFTFSSIREHLTLKTDFFVVTGYDSYNVDITNGIDTITSTKDQLLKVNSYLEEIPEVKKPNVGDDPNLYLRDLIRWRSEEELLRSYRLRDNLISILASGVIVSDKDFLLELDSVENEWGKKEGFASLIPERVSTYIQDK